MHPMAGHLHRAFGFGHPMADGRFPNVAAFAAEQQHAFARAFGPQRTFLPLPTQLSLSAWSPFLAASAANEITSARSRSVTSCPGTTNSLPPLPPPPGPQSSLSSSSSLSTLKPSPNTSSSSSISVISSPTINNQEGNNSESETEDSITSKLCPVSMTTSESQRKNHPGGSNVPPSFVNSVQIPSSATNGTSPPGSYPPELYNYYNQPIVPAIASDLRGDIMARGDPRTAALLAASTVPMLYPTIYSGLVPPNIGIVPQSTTVLGTAHPSSGHNNHKRSPSLNSGHEREPVPQSSNHGRGRDGQLTPSSPSDGTGLKDPNSNSIWRPY